MTLLCLYKGAHAEWEPHVDKLIMEMLVNRTPPTCIQANIFAMARVLFPEVDVVLELPSLRHIQKMRTATGTCGKAMAPKVIAEAEVWKQLHTDETSCRQTSLVNVVMGIQDENQELTSVCLSSSIIAEDGTADQQCRAILSCFDESGELLEGWREESFTLTNLSLLTRYRKKTRYAFLV